MTFKTRTFYFLNNTLFIRYKSSSVSGRICWKNIVKPETISLESWKQVLWVAKDLKTSLAENGRKNLGLLDNNHITLFFTKPHGRFQLSYALACDLLGAKRTLYHDPDFENQPFPGDGGRVLSTLTDMFVIHGLHHDVLVKVASNSTIPLFSASSDVYCFQKVLSDLMTYQETFQRLKGLTLAWIGPPNSILNSYIILCAKFDMKIQYTCICRYGTGRMSPVHRFPNLENEEDHDGFKEFKSAMETMQGAHIIATSMHPEKLNRITLEHLKNAEPDCVFMHSLPRSSKEVSNDVFEHEKNLSWKTSENYLYVAMAVILTSLKEYEPQCEMPDFDGVKLNK